MLSDLKKGYYCLYVDLKTTNSHFFIEKSFDINQAIKYMNKMKYSPKLITVLCVLAIVICTQLRSKNGQITKEWEIDFLDDFQRFNPENWQDQEIWVNNETHCYVPNNEFDTREVGNETLKIKVINIGVKRPCDNLDKQGKQHPDTEYVAGRIA